MSDNSAGPDSDNAKSGNNSPDLDSLGQRINALREQKHIQERKNHEFDASPANAGMAQAFRVGAELISALIVGVGIGWALDQWLGTKPWLMLVFFFLGAGAGILNVYRSTGLIGANAPEAGKNTEKGNNSTDSNDLD
ncbi:MAG: AtpZ/AtpI family protein [Rhodospirillaceae bacterium]|nr:AtpZ/AtpI family protein [Rhodospirillaceae bacterium]